MPGGWEAIPVRPPHDHIPPPHDPIPRAPRARSSGRSSSCSSSWRRSRTRCPSRPPPPTMRCGRPDPPSQKGGGGGDVVVSGACGGPMRHVCVSLSCRSGLSFSGVPRLVFVRMRQCPVNGARAVLVGTCPLATGRAEVDRLVRSSPPPCLDTGPQFPAFPASKKHLHGHQHARPFSQNPAFWDYLYGLVWSMNCLVHGDCLGHSGALEGAGGGGGSVRDRRDPPDRWQQCSTRQWAAGRVGPEAGGLQREGAPGPPIPRMHAVDSYYPGRLVECPCRPGLETCPPPLPSTF